MDDLSLLLFLLGWWQPHRADGSGGSGGGLDGVCAAAHQQCF
jgi:hypothetical protein